MGTELQARLRTMPTCSCAGDGTESPNLYEQAADHIDALEADNRQKDARLQELEVALRRSERKLTAYVGVCKDDKELTKAVLPMVRGALSGAPDATVLVALARVIASEAYKKAGNPLLARLVREGNADHMPGFTAAFAALNGGDGK